jgi:hypothetical protein
MLKPVLLSIIGLFFCVSTYATTFDEVWKLASKDNPGLQAAVHSYKAQLEQTKQARAGLLPSLVFDASVAKNSSNAVFTNKSSVETRYSENYDSSVYTLKFVQPVFRAESFIAYEEAKKYPEIGRILLKKTNEELFGAVLEAFANVVHHPGDEPAEKEELMKILADADGCITSWGVAQLDADVMNAAPKLKPWPTWAVVSNASSLMLSGIEKCI